MDKKEIKSKIDEVRAQIKSNSKDAHFADKLISELLSLKGQYEHQPTMVHIPMDEVVDTIKGDTFTLYKTSSGLMGYHLPCGYDVVVSPAVKALHDNMQWFLDNKETIDTMTEEEQEFYRLDLDCTIKMFTLPMFAAVDYDLKYDVATLFVKYMLRAQETLENMELLPEDLDSYEDFKEIMMAINDIKDELNTPTE